jgi:lipid-binding SYLF domain-containing protein
LDFASRIWRNDSEEMMEKREFIVVAASVAGLSVISACTTTGPGGSDPATRRQAIDGNVDAALARLHTQISGSKELVSSARGVLIFPSVVSAGFIVGAASGEGTLRESGKTTGYYRMTEGSVGLLAGAQSQAVFVLFMTPQALQQFKDSRGWTAGVDASVTVINVGANAAIDTRTVQQPVVGFVMTNAGLMANLSLNGSRITRLDL